jgi:hypothetical protein
MHGQKTGKGQVYMATYKDSDCDWLDGGTNYVFHVDADALAEAFWSLTAYEVSTRTLIQNEQEIADRSSRMDLSYNDDGSVDVNVASGRCRDPGFRHDLAPPTPSVVQDDGADFGQITRPHS